MGFDLSNYEPVEDRIAKFWADHPDGRITTRLVAHGDGEWVVAAEVYRGEERDPMATGLAQEQVTDRGVNATSALENCETSAIGRALANAGYAAKGKRPSREEMERVGHRSGPPVCPGCEKPVTGEAKKIEGVIWHAPCVPEVAQ